MGNIIEADAKFYTQRKSTINGREIGYYLISCPVGNIFLVQYEQKDMEIKQAYLGFSYVRAEEAYTKTCVKMAKGTL